jgi:beta-alanine degradation protein BauB
VAVTPVTRRRARTVREVPLNNSPRTEGNPLSIHESQTVTDQPLAGTPVGQNFAEWSEAIRDDFTRNAYNGRVGSRLLSGSPRVRVWEIRLQPGERLGAHRHVLDYFWVAIVPGRSRQRTADGTTREVSYTAGETRHFAFGPGEYLLHDLENIGPTELVFSTVEFLDGQNTPLPLD